MSAFFGPKGPKIALFALFLAHFAHFWTKLAFFWDFHIFYFSEYFPEISEKSRFWDRPYTYSGCPFLGPFSIALRLRNRYFSPKSPFSDFTMGSRKCNLDLFFVFSASKPNGKILIPGTYSGLFGFQKN